MTEQRITSVLRLNLPPAVSCSLKVGQKVLVYMEKSRRWVGLYDISRLEEKRAFISDGSTIRPFNFTKWLPYIAVKCDLELKLLLHCLSELQSAPVINITKLFYPSDVRARIPECKVAIEKKWMAFCPMNNSRD